MDAICGRGEFIPCFLILNHIVAQVHTSLYEFQKLNRKPACWNTAGSESEQQELAQDGCVVFTCPDSTIKIYSLIMFTPGLLNCFGCFF